ncbi:WG repeat-containing protein [Fulvivirga sp. 29W222]|uniref:WG repeat-containing protein n=1 Tax=Fulvivirga marina TaxID=2494733 RepID=A0A937KEF7_9BACT|nr:WG repeat-containing protein [Fulvivirga marina]MBL6447080.1 WG repeat-containing protein [Fulvivirga marina]
MRILTSFILFFVIHVSYGQVGLAKRALKQLEKGDWVKSTVLVDKALEKDSLLPATLYAKSRVLIDTTSLRPEIDSAYFFILKARVVYDSLDEKVKKQHVKVGIDSLALELLKNRIDSIAFQRALKTNSEAGFVNFLEKFSTAAEIEKAKRLRNELAYASAKAENTYKSYQLFMEKYPDAKQVGEAKQRYEKLYFSKSTADGKLRSYLKFLKENPDTPYRYEAEVNIYEVMTADNSVDSYINFIRQFPRSKVRPRAIAFLYHVLKEEGKYLPKSMVTDSLARVITLEGRTFVPVLENGKYGFMDTQGNEIISPVLTRIFEGELCGGIRRDYLLTGDEIVSPGNALIYAGKYEQVDDLGYGLLKVRHDEKFGIVHKSGRVLLPILYDDVRLLKGIFIAFKRNDLWGLKTISGREIVGSEFTDISIHETFVILEKGDLIYAKNINSLIVSVDNKKLDLGRAYSDFELVNETQLWLDSDNGEAVIDAELHEIIPYADQKIKILKKGFLINKDGRYYVLNETYRPVDKEPAFKASVNEAWVALRSKADWLLYDKDSYTLRSRNLDSLNLLGDYYAVMYRNDSVVVVTREKSLLLSSGEKLSLLSSVNASQYLIIDDGRKKRIYNPMGQLVFSGTYDDAKPLGPHYIVISQRGRKGILSDSAQVLLRAEYDAIANYQDGFVSLLKNKKFGLYNKEAKVLISAEYEKNIHRYNDWAFIAMKRDKLGLISQNNDQLTDFAYDEIMYWSDSVALVKTDYRWSLYNFQSKQTIDEGIKTLQIVAHNNEEQIAIVLRDTGYGVLSNRRGKIISATYNDVINVGTEAEPIFFAEKHIAEADLYIVIYYDMAGHPIRKQTFETADYPLIYCDN